MTDLLKQKINLLNEGIKKRQIDIDRLEERLERQNEIIKSLNESKYKRIQKRFLKLQSKIENSKYYERTKKTI